MGSVVGTVITVKELYGVKSADIQFRNGTNSTPLITLEEKRKYIVPYFQTNFKNQYSQFAASIIEMFSKGK
ncbi:hypothetical protein HMPREF9099_01772 [Lachnospiraceae bacterium oral taxon 082 str. F0431]|nr:hypothetical protein HMPREF9099_01772 [Lachnospiraceae bacterium oral taxon 082 str. F0431]